MFQRVCSAIQLKSIGTWKTKIYKEILENTHYYSVNTLFCRLEKETYLEQVQIAINRNQSGKMRSEKAFKE